MLIVLYVGTQLASSLMIKAPTMDQTQRRLMLLLKARAGGAAAHRGQVEHTRGPWGAGASTAQEEAAFRTPALTTGTGMTSASE